MTQETSTKSTPRDTPYSASVPPFLRFRLLDLEEDSGAGELARFLRFRDLGVFASVSWFPD